MNIINKLTADLNTRSSPKICATKFFYYDEKDAITHLFAQTLMKSTLKSSILLSLVAAFSAGAQAQNNAPRAQRALTMLPELSSHRQQIPATTTTNQTQNSTSGVSAALSGPAPGLSAMWVYAVGSSNCGWEYTAGKTTTTCDHGGVQLRSAVLEIGYGSNSIAWMNGGLLPRSAMYASTPVCVTGGYYTWPCTAGQTVVGFLNEYTLDGYQTGIFKYQNTSTNSPWNTMSVQIKIL